MHILFDARAAIPYLPGINRYAASLAAALAEAIAEEPGSKLSLVVPARDALPDVPATDAVQRIVCELSPFDPRQQRALDGCLRRKVAAHGVNGYFHTSSSLISESTSPRR